MRRQGGLSVAAMCELAQVARSGYYRYLRDRGGEARLLAGVTLLNSTP
jgi:hypothetical protein